MWWRATKEKRKDHRKFEALEGLHTKSVRILVKAYTVKEKWFVSSVPWHFSITKCKVTWNYGQMLFNTRPHSECFVLWKIGGPVTFSPTFIPLSIPHEPQKKIYKHVKVRISEVFIPHICPQNNFFFQNEVHTIIDTDYGNCWVRQSLKTMQIFWTR